ncbi:hypothetical protein Q31a_01770 [Aureliella helgolandensis]|uniref:Uncharacterized protein n=1 Tax=Aureliella helgolandensis TaxID=2527968 RepID=A0A518FZW2_9BACT|nr:hypothetical protein Q31a_01770 [Aureliella helgolandensis]
MQAACSSWIGFANVQARHWQLPYGDQSVFLRGRTFFELGGYSHLVSTEACEWSPRLRRAGRLRLLAQSFLTPDCRWKRMGTVRITIRIAT